MAAISDPRLQLIIDHRSLGQLGRRRARPWRRPESGCWSGPRRGYRRYCRRWCGCRRWGRCCDAIDDSNRVDAPTGGSVAIVASQPPPKSNVLARRGRGQVNRCCNKSTRIAAPGVAASDGALEATTDHVRIAADHKAATSIKDVLEGSAADAYLQYATVKAAFKVQVLAEGQLRRVAPDRYDE